MGLALALYPLPRGWLYGECVCVCEGLGVYDGCGGDWYFCCSWGLVFPRVGGPGVGS